jgi:hypothetical protein
VEGVATVLVTKTPIFIPGWWVKVGGKRDYRFRRRSLT